MAFDSAARRRAAGTRPGFPTTPAPDGSISAADRAELSGVYPLFYSSSEGTGSLFVDSYHEVVKVTLTSKADGTTASYHFAFDFFAAGGLYDGSPAVYPLLAQSPRVAYGVEGYSGSRADMTVSLYAKTDVADRGQTFATVLAGYELQGARVDVYRYEKPRLAPATHADGVNLRAAAYEVVGAVYDDGSGLFALTCRDVWFRDKELNRTYALPTADHPDPRYDGEFGTVVFGQSSLAGEGIVIDAPVIKSSVTAGKPTLRLFQGWAFDSGTHCNAALNRLLVRNRHKGTNTDDWVETDFALDPQTAVLGEAQATPASDPPNFPLDMSYYKRGRSFGISAAGDGTLVSAVRAKLSVPQYDRAADVIAGQFLWNNNNPDFLSADDADLSVEFWGKFDALHNGSKVRVVMQQGDIDAGTLEWIVYFNTADDKLRFSISHDGTSLSDTIASTAAITSGTWNHYVFSYFAGSNQLKMWLDGAAGAVTPVATTGDLDRRNGVFSVGTKGTLRENFDGKLKSLRVYRFALDTANVTDLYGSGQPIVYAGLADAYRTILACNYDLSEPKGLRDDQHGSATLTPGAVNQLIPQDVAYAYSNRPLTLTNAYGTPQLRISEAELLDGGNSVQPTGSALFTGSVDVTALSTTASDVFFQVDPPLLLCPGVTYLFELDFDNPKTESYFVKCSWNANPGSSHFFQSKRETAPAWQKSTDNRLDLEVYAVGSASLGLATTEHAEMGRLSYVDLDGKTVTLVGDQEFLEIDAEVEVKAGVTGLKDDGAGTYTTVADAVIKCPADILLFTLRNADFGVGLPADRVDLDGIRAAGDALNAHGLAMQIALTRSAGADDFVRELARQSRTVVYKRRTGEMTLVYPTPLPPPAACDVRLHEGRLRGELAVRADANADNTTAVNDFRQFYRPDVLNLPDDPALLRKSNREKLAGKLVTNDAVTDSGTEYHTALCARSKALFGPREMTAPLDFYDNPTAAGLVQRYYVARYALPPRRVQVQVPTRTFYAAIDLFSTVHLSHTGLRSAVPTAAAVPAHRGGLATAEYHRGVPTTATSGGTVSGIVTAVLEEGPWMTLTVETLPSF